MAGVTDTLLELALHEAEKLDKTNGNVSGPVDPSVEKQRQNLLELAKRLLQSNQVSPGLQCLAVDKLATGAHSDYYLEHVARKQRCV